MNAAHFGAITRLVFKNPPRINWDKAQESPQKMEQAKRKEKEGWSKFSVEVNAYLRKLELQNAAAPDYYAAAIPVGWLGNILVVDGPDLDRFAKDMLLEQQKFLSAFEKRLTAPGGANSRPLQPDETTKLPIPRVYNWGAAHQTGYVVEREYTSAEEEIKRQYWQNKATKTIEITI